MFQFLKQLFFPTIVMSNNPNYCVNQWEKKGVLIPTMRFQMFSFGISSFCSFHIQFWTRIQLVYIWNLLWVSQCLKIQYYSSNDEVDSSILHWMHVGIDSNQSMVKGLGILCCIWHDWSTSNFQSNWYHSYLAYKLLHCNWLKTKV